MLISEIENCCLKLFEINHKDFLIRVILDMFNVVLNPLNALSNIIEINFQITFH